MLEELAIAIRKHPCTSLCACPRGVGKTTGHCLPHPSYSPDLAPCDFFFLYPLERIATWALISVGHKGRHMEHSCKYISAVSPAAIPTLANLHSSQRQLFKGRMWMYVCMCYLVTWCDKNTVHEINDCSIIS
jgi:hypothetical protein